MNEHLGGRLIDLLLVEDNPADADLARCSLKASSFADGIRVHHVRDGLEALDFVHKRGAHATAPTPDLVLLDLMIPRKSGHEVLKEIKGDPRLKLIPVVILSSSAARADVIESYALHANGYIRKPMDLDQSDRIASAIDAFWFSVARLPTDTGP